MNDTVDLILRDIPRTYTGIAEWMACMLFALQLRPRLPKVRFWLVSAFALIVQCLFLVVTDDIVAWLWVVCMVVAVAMMMLLILMLCDVDGYVAVYTGIRAFILAEFTAALEWQIHSFFWPAGDAAWWQKYGLMLLIYCAVFVVMALLERNCIPNHREPAIQKNELLTALLIGISIFAISNMSFYLQNTPFSSQYSPEIMNIRTLVDLSGVVILFAFHLQRSQAQAVKELSALQTILENQYAQYRMSRESIEMINRKYHDLKHQITALRAEQDPTIRERWLDEMEADIHTYEAQNKTGNSILDTVLTGKSLYCQKHGIELSVVADGGSLSFMDTMDICTLFGNALDNAIECELKIPDREKRLIHLRLTTQKQFLLLQVENYCPDPPEFQGGLPVTTKSDGTNHGFGLKSIQYTAGKYGGTTTVHAEGGWFVLKVLIPLREQ